MAISFRQLRIDGSFFITFLIILFALSAIASFVFLHNSGQLTNFKVNMFSSIGPDNFSTQQDIKDINLPNTGQDLSIGATSTTSDNSNNEATNENEQNKQGENEQQKPATPIFSFHRSYKEQAKSGDSVTTLARKALKDFVEENWSNWDFITPEHKIFIENYIQKHTSDKELQIGEKITFSEDLITEAINKSKGLSSDQLKELKNYSEIVWTPGFRN